MTKLNIPLNGSNYVSDQRNQAFNDALDDDHRIDGGCEDQISISQTVATERSAPSLYPQSAISKKEASEPSSTALSQALEHTFNHQSRTMEIHQQYLAQQAEYIQLITAVLDQQGKVLHKESGSSAVQLVETLQRTLDNFHALREQGILVHQEFLHQQATFSERYLDALENGTLPKSANGNTPSPPTPVKDTPSMEWIVQQPPIVVDNHSRTKEISPAEDPPEKPTRILEAEQDTLQNESIPAAELEEALLEIVAEKTGYPADMLEMNMDLEADLGIDSIKRVEILGSLEERYPSLPPADTEVLAQTRTLQDIIEYMNSEASAAQTPSLAVPDPERNSPAPITSQPESNFAEMENKTAAQEELSEILMEIVAEKTGYPADMLETDMDMEADLGIDSIKRVEILGAMEERVPGLPPVETEKLAELRTLGQIIELMGSAPLTVTPPVGGSFEENKKKAHSTRLEITPVRLIELPVPDQLDFEPDTHRPVIVTDDHSELAYKTASELQDQGWKVVIWRFPDEYYPSNQNGGSFDLPVVQQGSAGSQGIEAALEQIRREQGSPMGLIHIHPQPDGKGFFSEMEDRLIKQVFLLAGELKSDLAESSSAGRNIFLSVIRSDGSLALTGESAFQKGTGLSGLVKTLRWEWPEVFCRFVDLDYKLDNDLAGRHLMQEIHDPDRGVVEVGISSTGRSTIERDYKNSHA